MGVFNLFSKRQKRLRGEVPEVYNYEEIPESLRIQIIHIIRDTLGNKDDCSYYPRVRGAYEFINNTLCREYGVFSLVQYSSRERVIEDIFNFFLEEKNFERVLDVIELCFRFIDNYTREWDYLKRNNASKKADDAINELNSRFKEHGIGYEYRNGEIIRIDSELIHAEAVKPALILLTGNLYKAANTEFFTSS